MPLGVQDRIGETTQIGGEAYPFFVVAFDAGALESQHRPSGDQFGDQIILKAGMWELSVHVGRGDRIHYRKQEKIVVLLLGGSCR